VSDFKRILDGLNGAGVRYVLVGGIALIRHGVVRATGTYLLDLRDLEIAHGELPDSRTPS
jgi:hypothetical protein